MISAPNLLTILEHELQILSRPCLGGYSLAGNQVQGQLLVDDTGWLLVLDHEDCWCKPITAPLKSSQAETYSANYLDRLFTVIRFLGTEEGFQCSDEHRYLSQPIWPLKEFNATYRS